MWSREIDDPEFRKNLRVFRYLVDGAIEVCGRAQIMVGPGGSAVDAANTDNQRRAAAVVGRLGEFRERITLPAGVPLTLKTLLDHRFELEQLLIELGDREYLARRLADLYDEERGTHSTWRTLFGDQLPALLPGPIPAPTRAAAELRELQRSAWPPGEEEVELTRRRLARLMSVKQADDQAWRMRWELKRRAALLVTWVLAIVTSGFGVAVARVVAEDRALLAAVAAGAAGAALGGLIRLRDQVSLGAQVRQFRPFFLGQVVVGATAGLATFLADASGIVTISGAATGVAAAGFALGFSEAAFVGLLTRIAAASGSGSGKDKERHSEQS
jgi:hypothetical protein